MSCKVHTLIVLLQGYMSGKDFARSVVCSVHTSQVEAYLAKVDAMPEELANAQVFYLCSVLSSAEPLDFKLYFLFSLLKRTSVYCLCSAL